MAELRTRDPKFICICGDTIVHTRTQKDGRRVFKCDKGTDEFHAKLLECTVCHFPRSIWADDGNICGNCCVAAMEGKIQLTPEQVEGINKWRVTVRV